MYNIQYTLHNTQQMSADSTSYVHLRNSIAWICDSCFTSAQKLNLPPDTQRPGSSWHRRRLNQGHLTLSPPWSNSYAEVGLNVIGVRCHERLLKGPSSAIPTKHFGWYNVSFATQRGLSALAFRTPSWVAPRVSPGIFEYGKMKDTCINVTTLISGGGKYDEIW